ncbi:hypothetical protein NHX12_020310 [Muraenolepis orangiensis]|uniref:Proline and serine-rich protein 2 n=1 Tax=Muraenolepis orangiensis TaxID=630683 RepID=A0A9Q0EUU4_9TELE|nr:hypothetical protein NHX12_020310 [Muraenolepis orangiensis]
MDPEAVTLKQLEQECLQFFESTIDSLDDSIEEGDEQNQRAAGLASEVLDRPTAAFRPVSSVLNSSPAGSPGPQSRTANLRDHDIIDLVRPEPDLVQTSPTVPDLHSVAAHPGSPLEVKPWHEAADMAASEYNPPTTAPSSYLTPDGRSNYCPPGCVPTPVLIAQKIAENQGGSTSDIGPSGLHPRRSLEPEPRSSGLAPEHMVKLRPPTSAKPAHFPANISVTHGNKEPNQSLANMNIHERQARMLANLPGTSQHEGREETPPDVAQKELAVPNRSVSFRDPTPSKSRMEALSKLGLRGRAQSGDVSLYVTPQSVTSGQMAPTLPRDGESSRSPAVRRAASDRMKTDSKQDAVPANSSVLTGSVEKKVYVRPPPGEVVHPAQVESKPLPLSPPPKVASLDFNSYGGKSAVIKPGVPSKGDPSPAQDSPDGKAPPSGAGRDNVYKSPVMPPSSHLPDILSAHIDQRRTLPPPPPPVVEVNDFGGRTLTINPSAGSSFSGPTRTARAPPPSTATKPLTHRSSVNLPRPAAASPEARRRSASTKAPAFRSQGITVQFSGKGAMDESRRAALRKLGLMRDAC